MANKTYTVRVPMGAPDIAREHAAAWLDAQLASNAPLAADPGAGERTLRLSLDAEKVKAGAAAVDEPEAVFLRRLVASNVHVPEEAGKPEPEPKPKAPVLKGALRLQPEQVRPLVHVFEVGQSYVIRKAFRVPPHPAVLQAAAYTEEEREQLSVAGCEALNRRAPRVLVENIDLVGLATTIIAVESRKIEAVQVLAEQYHAIEEARRAAQQTRVPEAQQ